MTVLTLSLLACHLLAHTLTIKQYLKYQEHSGSQSLLHITITWGAFRTLNAQLTSQLNQNSCGEEPGISSFKGSSGDSNVRQSLGTSELTSKQSRIEKVPETQK